MINSRAAFFSMIHSDLNYFVAMAGRLSETNPLFIYLLRKARGKHICPRFTVDGQH